MTHFFHNSNIFLGSAPFICEGNTLFFFSTLEEFTSYRSPENGSVFINNLCDVIEEDGDKLHMEDLMIRTTDRMLKDVIKKRNVQIPEKKSTLSKFYTLPPKE